MCLCWLPVWLPGTSALAHTRILVPAANQPCMRGLADRTRLPSPVRGGQLLPVQEPGHADLPEQSGPARPEAEVRCGLGYDLLQRASGIRSVELQAIPPTTEGQQRHPHLFHRRDRIPAAPALGRRPGPDPILHQGIKKPLLIRPYPVGLPTATMSTRRSPPPAT